MKICERCRADEARCFPADVALCYGCASDLHVLDGVLPHTSDAEHGLVGQQDGSNGVQEAGFFCDIPGPIRAGKNLGDKISNSDAGQAMRSAPGAIEKTADAAGQIAKTIKVVAVIVGVAGAAWVGYALWKARQQAIGLQAGAQHALLAHPELLRI